MIKKHLSTFGQIARQKKDSLIYPLTRVLVKHHISANELSTLSLIIGLIGVFSLFISPKLYFFFIVLSRCFDYLDGSVARFSSQKSKYGYWIDYFSDRIVEFSAMVVIYYLYQPETRIYSGALMVIYLLNNIIYVKFHKDIQLIHPTMLYFCMIFINPFIATMVHLVWHSLMFVLMILTLGYLKLKNIYRLT